MSKPQFKIHPAVGVARVGNSQHKFYLAPETIGGLPISCDEFGNEKKEEVTKFKDDQGAIKRQGAKFRVFKYDDQHPHGVEVNLNSGDVESMEWTVHIANKKAGFWNFSEQIGNTMIAPDNTYEEWAKKGKATLRNADVEGPARQKLIIDPGPRTLSGKNKKTDFSDKTIPKTYKFGSFPKKPTSGLQITTLGDMCTDNDGNVTVIAALGHAGGNTPISSYAGADTWHDDTADGQVTCTLTLKTGEKIVLNAWVLCASTKFAPQLVNITTLGDNMLDVAVRYKNYMPDAYDAAKYKGGWNPNFVVNFERDVLPILSRPKDYIWVANVPSMVAFSYPQFNTHDNSEANKTNRQTYFSYWRNPVQQDGHNGYNTLWNKDSMMPLMPLNSGTNSVTNEYIEKFLTLTQTQYFFLQQWADGKFTNDKSPGYVGVHPLDEASVGNCVGLPMSPGIEVTWSVNNPALYEAAYRVQLAHDEAYYNAHGLDPLRDETKGGGCEPGDLSKRMAIPWQADFFQCTVQFINFTNNKVNKDGDIPLAPTYYSYWWPPQSPWDVITGSITATEQAIQGVPAGVQVNYARGINSFSQMILGWKYLGFVVNQNDGPASRQYPYFVERERNDDKFEVAAVAVGGASVLVSGDDSTFTPAWYLKDDVINAQDKPAQTTAANESAELDYMGGDETDGDYITKVRKVVAAETTLTAEETQTKKVQATLGRPRSGTRVRF